MRIRNSVVLGLMKSKAPYAGLSVDAGGRPVVVRPALLRGALKGVTLQRAWVDQDYYLRLEAGSFKAKVSCTFGIMEKRLLIKWADKQREQRRSPAVKLTREQKLAAFQV